MVIANKRLGQHWLNDPASLSAIVDAAAMSKDDTILEIGPGQGSLTKVLVKYAKKVIAVELDESLAEDLSSLLVADNLQVIHQNILDFDLTLLPHSYKVVANIPYYLTSHLLRRISETSRPPELAVLLVQQEVAQRVAATPGSMSLLSVTAQYYWQVELGRVFPAELFDPPPKVDSQLLILTRRSKPLFNVDTQKFFHLVRVGFAQRRKTLVNNLMVLNKDRQLSTDVLHRAQIDETSRAQNLSLDDWYKLYQAMENT